MSTAGPVASVSPTATFKPTKSRNITSFTHHSLVDEEVSAQGVSPHPFDADAQNAWCRGFADDGQPNLGVVGTQQHLVIIQQIRQETVNAGMLLSIADADGEQLVGSQGGQLRTFYPAAGAVRLPKEHGSRTAGCVSAIDTHESKTASRMNGSASKAYSRS